MSTISRNILFGDDENRNFTNFDLPKNRKQQFTYLLKTRFSKLFYVNLLVCLLALPLLIWHILCLTYSFSFGEINADNFGKYFQYILYYKSTLRLLLAIPASYGIVGGLYTIRLISWGEPISLFKTFFKGIKLNIGQFTFLGILYGVFAGIYDAANALLSFVYTGSGVEKTVFHIVMILSAVLLASVAMFLITLCSTYNIKLMSAITNSAILVGKTLIKTLGILCISVLPVGIMLSLGNIYIAILAITILLLFGFSFIIMVIGLYTNGIYDEIINRTDYPDYYRRGLAVLESADGLTEVKNA